MNPAGIGPTRVLLCSYAFHPGIGGIETVALFLAEHLVKRGLDVVVVTNTPARPGIADDFYPCPVYRKPGRKALFQLVRSCDLVFHCNISVTYLWPLLLVPRPLVISTQTPIDATIEKSAIKRWVKMQVLKSTHNTACSKFMADQLPVFTTVLYNPLRRIFRQNHQVERNKDIIFVGRLSDSKGVDTLLEALSLLSSRGLRPGLTIVGGGAEEAKLRALCTSLGLEKQVDFVGFKQASEIAQLLNQHEIIAVPSRRKPAEALGIVAMEGIACGAVPVVAQQGGLLEAIGPCGLSFECENPVSLADKLQCALESPETRERFRARSAEFLERFDEDVIVEQYLKIFSAVLKGKLSVLRTNSFSVERTLEEAELKIP